VISKLVGTIEAAEAYAVQVRLGDSGVTREVLVTAWLAGDLAGRVGQTVVLHTFEYLESPNQGSTFLPRLVGFATPEDRRFFEVFTSVRGIGNRKALRALARPTAEVAGAIAAGDASALARLPEIGARLAATIIADLRDKAGAFVGASGAGGSAPGYVEPSPLRRLGGAGDEAVAALAALGDSPAEAERRVRAALARDPGLTTAAAIVTAALGTPSPGPARL